jgi:broad specificity phosphatase PhoE
MRLIIVRHAQTEANVARINEGHGEGTLTKIGEEQAEKLVDRLKDEHIDVIYCSDLKRARDTLAPLLKFLSVPVHYTPLLRDINHGIFEGAPYGTKNKHIQQENLDKWTFRPENGESMEDVDARIVSFLRQIMNEHMHETVLIVSHRNPISHIYQYLKNSKENFYEDMADNAVCTIVEINPGRVEFIAKNCPKHLGGE